jgi:hypothetical protein
MESNRMEKYAENVKVAIIQTTLNGKVAWENAPEISYPEEKRAREELRNAFRSLHAMDDKSKPHFVLIPELSVPRGYIKHLRTLAEGVGCIVIAGIDYTKFNDSSGTKVVKNQGIIIVPRSWPSGLRRKGTEEFKFGKMYGAPKEVIDLQKLGWKFLGDSAFWLIDADRFGKLGVCICYDFMDVERFIMYRGTVQHFFVLAYNQDINTFINIANTACRTVYCNVIVCNTGHYGGSIAVSPTQKSYLRTRYQHLGLDLYTTQIVSFPVKDLIRAQHTDPYIETKGDRVFTGRPPGFINH